jgi:hypothetical protein
MYDTVHRTLQDGVNSEAIYRWAVSALSEVATDHSQLVAVRHPLGFICLPLERSGTRGVCVHWWTDRLAQAVPTTTTTHAHSWDLISFVLFGSLCNELVEVSDHGGLRRHRVFEVASGAGGDEIRRTNRLVSSQLRTRNLYRAGDVYTLSAGVFHRTTGTGQVATVALGNGRRDAADLVLGDLGTPSHRVRRQVCDRAETITAASVLARRLAEGLVTDSHRRLGFTGQNCLAARRPSGCRQPHE